MPAPEVALRQDWPVGTWRIVATAAAMIVVAAVSSKQALGSPGDPILRENRALTTVG